MRTPSGKECKFFYGDYYRGRQREECRLLASKSPRIHWRPALCETCPVPDIMLANACPHMQLEPRLERSIPLMKQKVGVKTYCQESHQRGFDPHIGCGHCHESFFVLPGENP